MQIQYKLNNTLKSITIPENKTVEDLQNIIKNTGQTIELFFNETKMDTSQKLEKYNLINTSIIIVKIIKLVKHTPKNFVDNIISTVLPSVNLSQFACAFGPRGNEWVWSK